jgi:uncharacterized protein (TIGR02246 family)
VNDDDIEIRRVIALYAQLVDDGRLDEWAELFTHDAVFTFWGHVYQGRGSIKRAMESMRTGTSSIGKHLVLTPVITVDGVDTGRAWTDFVAIVGDDEGLRVVAAGRYYDRIVRDEGRWRFSRRDIRAAGEQLPPGANEVPPF